MDASRAAEIEAATELDDDTPPSAPQTIPDQRDNDMIINKLRRFREGDFTYRSGIYFRRRFLQLNPELPLPELEECPSNQPWLLSIEHLQDFCNKSTTIYYTGMRKGFFENMYDFILAQWAPGGIHKLDIEFARFFAKLVGIARAPPPTTEEIVSIHQELCEASQIARETGFAKKENWTHIYDYLFTGGQQTEFYNIKPLLRALIIVIDKRISETETDFDKQEVRLVLTGFSTGLSRAIDFENLTVLKTINENEVVTTLPEAVRFVMHLDRREEVLAERRDPRVLDHYLGIPKAQIEKYQSAWAERYGMRWTGEIPIGPSTNWWNEGVTDEAGNPLGWTMKY